VLLYFWNDGKYLLEMTDTDVNNYLNYLHLN